MLVVMYLSWHLLLSLPSAFLCHCPTSAAVCFFLFFLLVRLRVAAMLQPFSLLASVLPLPCSSFISYINLLCSMGCLGVDQMPSVVLWHLCLGCYLCLFPLLVVCLSSSVVFLSSVSSLVSSLVFLSSVSYLISYRVSSLALILSRFFCFVRYLFSHFSFVAYFPVLVLSTHAQFDARSVKDR